MVQVQKAEIETDRNDKNFHSEDWEVFIECDTAKEALTYLVARLNGEEVDDVNHWFRAVDTNTETVL